jgi:conjugal transfer pilus assembly protein TraL
VNQDDFKLLIPSRLDDPPKFLWWDFDVAILAMGCMALGIMTSQVFIFSAAGGVVAMAYQKLKAGRSRAFGLHILYWFLPFSFGLKRTPPSSVREFIG